MDAAKAHDTYPIRSREQFIEQFRGAVEKAETELAQLLLEQSGQMPLLINKAGVEIVAFPDGEHPHPR